MSPRAASRLRSLGFREVYDYEAGKAEWTAYGLAVEGTAATVERAGGSVRLPPTCALEDSLGAVRQRVRAEGWEQCLVLDDDGVVLGRLGRGALAGDDARSVAEAMSEGPTTVRPDEELDPLRARLREQSLRSALVSTADGRLVGVVLLDS